MTADDRGIARRELNGAFADIKTAGYTRRLGLGHFKGIRTPLGGAETFTEI